MNTIEYPRPRVGSKATGKARVPTLPILVPRWRLDKRTAAAADACRLRDEIETALGGSDLSPQRTTLVDQIIRAKLYQDAIDADLLTQTKLITGNPDIDAHMVTLLRTRVQIAYLLSQLLAQIGLDRVAKRVPSLREHIEGRGTTIDAPPRSNGAAGNTDGKGAGK